MSWHVAEDGGEVMPLNDLKEHDHGIMCWCRPTVVDGWIIVHHALDKREEQEDE